MKNPKIIGVALALLVAVGVGGLLVAEQQKPEKTAIKNSVQTVSSFDKGSVRDGQNAGTPQTLKTGSKLTYDSPEVPTNQEKANAVGIQFDQTGSEEGTKVSVRTKDGKNWSDWYEVPGTDDRPDKAPTTHSAVVLTKDAKQMQYRFELASQNGQSPEISNVRLTAIDSTQGPNPTKKSVFQKLVDKAQAKPAGPRVYSRAEWGCPQPNSSPAWNPEYTPLYRVMIHHTAGYADPGNSAAAVRAVWQYHTYSNGWGDIGYNYLVDLNGNMFQGRYYDKNYAEANKREVVAGHTYGHNSGSIGISSLGDFTRQGPTHAMLDASAHLAGWKFVPYNINPAGGSTNPYSGVSGAAVMGHRDLGQTACPGGNLYPYLGAIRGGGSTYFTQYKFQFDYDYSFQGEGVVNGPTNGTVSIPAYQTKTVYLDLKNEGTATWQNAGANPVRIGTSHPMDRGSMFYHSSWLGGSRPSSFNQRVTINGDGSKSVAPATSIAPGQIARFEFNLLAPNVGGTFNEYFQPMVEGAGWMNDIGIHWAVTVIPEINSYQHLEQSANIPATPDTTATVNISIKNNGNTTWQKTGPNALKLGTSRPNDRPSGLYDTSWLSANRVATFAGKAQLNNGQLVKDGSGNVVYDSGATAIAPGEAAYFQFTMKTPNQPYAANEYFNFLIEGKQWMFDIGVYWPVNIGQGYQAQWVGQSAHPVIVKSSNPVGTLYFDYKNTGSYPWKKNGVVRLAPSNPLDRNSVFATFGLSSGSSPALPPNTQNWITANRAGTFAGKVNGGSLDTGATVIAPGETARFLIPLDARNVPASTRREYFRIVADNFAWLFDYGAYQDVTVQ